MYSNAATAHVNFLNSIWDAAIDGWKTYGVLPSLTVAQAILESAWGDSSLASKYYNLFGIKGSYNGKSAILKTSEYLNGRYVTVDAPFRAYSNLSESILDHGKFLSDNTRYHNLLWVKDSNTVTSLIRADGYATDPSYTSSLRSVIRTYNLTVLDQIAFRV